MTETISRSRKEKIISFIWQHTLLLISLYIMTLGVVLCIKSALGSSVISSLPLAFSIAGTQGLAPALSVGGYTIVMNFVFVIAQILLLRRRFEPVQLFQLLIGFVFGWFIDLNMAATQWLVCEDIGTEALVQFAGCSVMGFGIAMEVKCGSVTMPGRDPNIGGHNTCSPGDSELLPVLRTLAVEHNRSRHPIRHGLRRHSRKTVHRPLAMVRPSA